MARILVLGGTGQIGPTVVEYAQSRGHKLSVFNRNTRNPDAYKGIEQLVGDRNESNGHDALKGKKWDIVFDIPSTNPKWIADAAAVLKGNVGQYVYVSSTAAYKDYSKEYQNETYPTQEPAPLEPYDSATYGRNKVKCEQLVMENYGAGGTVVRAGYIVGRRDASGRFLYWPLRVQRGGEVLTPGKPDDPAQYIDVRDLGEWMVRLGESGTTGIFNATGPQTVASISEMLYGMKACFSNDARFTWVDQQFLTQNRVSFPVWMARGSNGVAFATSDVTKAKAAGLTFRTLADTTRDAIAWYETLPADQKARAAGRLTAEREAELLRLWRETAKTR